MPHPKFDYALSQARTLWLHHPVLGDPSWDSFERESVLPLFQGSPPLEWLVKGFSFLDPIRRALISGGFLEFLHEIQVTLYP
jgi:hypothetical protein